MANVEAFVEHICESSHLVNEFGVVSVAVLQMAHLVMDLKGQGSVRLSFGHCDGGIFVAFSGLSQGIDFSSETIAQSHSYLLVKSLADSISVSDEGKTIELGFIVNGVEVMQVKKRQRVLRSFFEPKTVEA